MSNDSAKLLKNIFGNTEQSCRVEITEISIFQILREIKVGESRVSKSAISTH